jgi:uncharacterized protein (TIGR03546 family)
MDSMVSLLLRPLRQLSLALMANDSPPQVAWGFTLGMLAGLVPKGSLLAVGLFMLLCALRVNKPAGLLALALFSLVGIWIDPFAHAIGALVLTWEPARPLHAWLYSLPLGPWTGLNNTVALGQLALGLYLVYPVYHITKQIVTRLQPQAIRWLQRFRATRWLMGLELGAQLSTR